MARDAGSAVGRAMRAGFGAALALALPCPPIVHAKQAQPLPTQGDPYKSYRIELAWSSGPAAGFKSMGLSLVVTGGGASPFPGPVAGAAKPYPLVLVDGVTWNPGFIQWAAQSVEHPAKAGLQSLQVIVRKTSGGATAGSYSLTGCWATSLQPVSMLRTAGRPWTITQLVLRCSPPAKPPPFAPWKG